MIDTPETVSRERGSFSVDLSKISLSLQSRISYLVDKGKTDLDPKNAFITYIWSEVEKDFQKMADDLAKACKEELNLRKVPVAVESRVKSRASIAKSLERREIYRQKGKEGLYKNLREILHDLHDLVGIRIIVDYLDQIDATTDFVNSTFRKEKEPNVFSANRKIGHSWTSWFGAYECTNHHVSAEYEGTHPLSYFNGVIFEIQVTSLPASLYNKISHPLLYKEEPRELSQGDEIVIDLTKGLAFCYSLCTYYKRYKLEESKRIEDQEMHLFKVASSATEGPNFIASISDLVERIPGIDTEKIRGKSIPRERLEMVLESLLKKEIQNDIGQSVADHLRQEIEDIGRPLIDLHAFGRARFDSQDVCQSPVCQEGTQIGAISYIHKWIEEGKTPLLWICSHAGTGKSTLARTIARDLTAAGQMAAGYFFKRGDVGRNHIRHLIPTIAAQLVLTIPQYESCLRESVDNCKNKDFENMLLFEQFKLLLKDPLSQLDHIPSTKVIIIDALDECVDLNQMNKVMDHLTGLEGLASIRFRLLVTSRDEDSVRAAIVRHPHEKLLLANTFHDDNVSDIESILRVGFQRIRTDRRIKESWPTEEQFREVVERSTNPSPLFIYAATLLRFLGDGTRLGVPKKRLESWIERSVGRTFTTQLDEMYTTVFENLDPDLGHGDSEYLMENEKASLRIILGAVALVVEPLSVSLLCDILELDLDVLELLKSCRAVLYVPDDNDEPVQMLHNSFSDFLFRKLPQGACWFNIDEKQQHELLAQGCIRHLKDRLTSNICQLRDPASLRVKIQPTIIQRYISKSLQYASSYWVRHVRSIGHSPALTLTVESFLYKRFLEWIECMAILGRLDMASYAIQELRANTPLDNELGHFLYDAYRFLLKHGPIIQQAPRQTYGSALLFSPTKSIIRTSFWSSRLPGCQDVRNMPEDWDSILQQIRLSPSRVVFETIALSSDGKLLASSHYQSEVPNHLEFYIQLWQSGTGAHLASTRIPDRATAMCWAEHGENLFFITQSGNVYQHDFSQDHTTLIGSRAFPYISVRLTAISPTGIVAVAHSDDTRQVSVWDALNGKTLLQWESIAPVSAIAISHDSCQVSVLDGRTVKLGNIETETFSDVIQDAFYPVLAFSSDSNRLFVLSGTSLNIVSIHERCYRTAPVPGYNHYSAIVVFPDQATIAALSDRDLWLWNIHHSAPQLSKHISDIVQSFSPNVEFNSSMSIEDFGYAEQIAISPDGKYLASLWNNRLYLWSLPGGKLVKLLMPKNPSSSPFIWHDRDIMSFSRDGSSILAACNSIIYVWALEQSESSEIELSPTATIYDRHVNSHDRDRVTAITAIWMAGKNVAIGFPNRVEMWNIQDAGHHLQTFETRPRNLYHTFAFSPAPELLAIGYDSTVTFLSVGKEDSRKNIRLPFSVGELLFSPDGSMLLLSDPEMDNPAKYRIWTAAVYSESSPSPLDQGFISPPIKCLPLSSEAVEVITGNVEFTYPNDLYSSAPSADLCSFSSDGMLVSSRWYGVKLYNIQHARHTPPSSKGLYTICEIYSPEMQTWIQRGSQRLIRIPDGYAQFSIVYSGRHVAYIDERGKIVILQFN